MKMIQTKKHNFIYVGGEHFDIFLSTFDFF